MSKNNPCVPQNEAERKIFFIEGQRVRLQNKICQKLNEKGLTREKVQAELNWTKKKTEQIFSSEFNLTSRELFEVLYLAGIELQFKIL